MDDKRLLKFFMKEYERIVEVVFPACSVAANKFIASSFCIVDFKVNSGILEGQVINIINLSL